MRATFLALSATVLLTGAAPALSQEASVAAPLAIKSGAMVKTADGQSIGAIDQVQMSRGKPVAVLVIYKSRFIHIPSATISGDAGKGFVTSLTRKEIARLD